MQYRTHHSPKSCQGLWMHECRHSFPIIGPQRGDVLLRHCLWRVSLRLRSQGKCEADQRDQCRNRTHHTPPWTLGRNQAVAPWHFLNFLPLPQGHGSLRPTPAYGLDAGAGGKPGGAAASGGPLLTSPSAVGLLATTGAILLFGAAPSGAGVAPPRGGPISICSLSHRSPKVACTSCIRPTNIS